MKVNEAPEKIYIPRLEGNETFVHEWSATKFRKYFSREIAENVEYTRTDAFIEKATEWIKNNGSHYIDIVNGQLILKKGIIKDFKNYMKGE